MKREREIEGEKKRGKDKRRVVSFIGEKEKKYNNYSHSL
jgi:hypothetical protein